jgi:hypothetical protein
VIGFRGYFFAAPPVPLQSLGSSISLTPRNFGDPFARHRGVKRSSIYWLSRGYEQRLKEEWKMDDFNSETDSDYTSYWRDWVSLLFTLSQHALACPKSAHMVLDKEGSVGTVLALRTSLLSNTTNAVIP